MAFMVSVPQVETLPLEMDAHGVIRVGKTRVTLDTVVAAFDEGATAEEIVQQYPTLLLADVYSVIGYYRVGVTRLILISARANRKRNRCGARTKLALVQLAFVNVYWHAEKVSPNQIDILPTP